MGRWTRLPCSQRFRTEALTPGLELCIVKRVDAGVAPQVSVWSVDGKDVSTTTLGVARPGTWGEVVALVPAESIGRSADIRERVMHAAVDVNAFRVEIYQLAPEDTLPRDPQAH